MSVNLNELDEGAKELLAKETPLRDTIIESLQKLEINWNNFAHLANTRRRNLQQSLKFAQILRFCEEI